jgi:SAM-dependent methyltransferase
VKPLFKNRYDLIQSFSTGLVLDIGCQEKRLSSSNSIGIDIRFNQNVNIIADAQFLPFKDGAFDTVIAGEIIEHLISPALLLVEARRVLKPTGTMILTTPNPWSITYFGRNFFGFGGSTSELSEHKFLWDIHVLAHLISTCNLRIQEIGFVDAYRNPLLKGLTRLHHEWSFHIFVICKQ